MFIQLNYYGRLVTLFKCKWANTLTNRGYRKDDLGFECVNLSHVIYTDSQVGDEPYVAATLAKMVYYVTDVKEPNWCIPIRIKPRDLYEMGDETNSGHVSKAFSAKSCLMLMMDQTNLSHGLVWRQNLIEALYLFQHLIVQINAYILFLVISL